MEHLLLKGKPINHHSIIIENLDRNIKLKNKKNDVIKKTQNDISDSFWKEENILTSINHELILKQMEIFEKNEEYYAKWHAAKIFLIEVPVWWTKKKLLILKDLLKKNDFSNDKILNEYSQYLKSHQLLSNSWDKLVQIPKPYWVINDHDWNVVLILDYISWMTLFSFKVSLILPILYDQLVKDIWIEKTINLLWERKLYENLKTDKKNKESLLKILSVFRFNNNGDFYKKYLSFYNKYSVSDAYKWTRAEYQMAKIYDLLSTEYNLWLLSNKQITYIKDSLVENIWILNQNNIYHNDMNQRNIILWDDGILYIIDFDKAKNKPKTNKYWPDPKYMQKHKWIYLEWDFKIIKDFSSLEKSL